MKKISILIKKELTEILRDKKTLIIMILIPLILYPSIIVGVSMGVGMIIQSQEEGVHTVGYLLEEEGYIKPLIALYEQEKEDFDAELTFQGVSKEDEASAREESDAWISFSKEGNSIQIELSYTSTNQSSNYTEDIMQELTESYCDTLVVENLEKEGLTEDFMYPVVYEAVDSATTAESMGVNMGGSVGMLLIMMILMGAFYPAVDVTAGEKERGTLETLLTLPVTNFQMIMSKFISVSIIASTTAILSLIAFGGSVLFLMFALPAEMTDEMVQLPIDVFVNSIPVLLLVMITTALLITAFNMCFCIFAKSAKEANNYMTPVMLIVMVLTMIGMIPTVELNYKFALIPIINVSLLIKQVLAQRMDIALAFITALVNFAYSIITIWILAKLYDSEDIMFSDDFRSLRLFRKREDMKQGTIPAAGDVIISLVVLLLAMIYIGGAVSAREPFIGTVVTQLMIVATPLALTWYMKSDMKKLFCLRSPKKSMVLGSILLYIGTYLIMFALGIVLTNAFPDNMQGLEDAFQEITKHSFVPVVLVLAVMPAIGEELLFRGFVFGSMRNKYKIGWSIFISAIFFGAFHMNLVKLIPTGLLGAGFAYIVYKSGSIFITMLLHFINNFVSVIAMKYPEVIEKLLPFMIKEDFSITELVIMFILGGVFAAAGIFLMNRQKDIE